MSIAHQTVRDDLEVAIIIASYGDSYWSDLARRRALPSAARAARFSIASTRVVQSEREATLQLARNVPAISMPEDPDWLIFLDADDELDDQYVAAMQARIQRLPPGDFIIQPSTLGVVDGLEDPYEVMIPAKPSLWDGNHCVIGSAIPHELFLRVGGFDGWEAWEDWGLWLKCMKAGAQFVTCPEAIYRVHIDPARSSRNQIDSARSRSLFQEMRSYYQRWEVPT